MRIKRRLLDHSLTTPSRHREARAKARRINQVQARFGREYAEGWVYLLERMARTRQEEAIRAMQPPGLRSIYKFFRAAKRASLGFLAAARGDRRAARVTASCNPLADLRRFQEFGRRYAMEGAA